MPIYEYECECGHKFELKKSITDESPTPCPECQKHAKRLISLSSMAVEKNAMEALHQDIKPEAKKLAKSIEGGNENALMDITGLK